MAIGTLFTLFVVPSIYMLFAKNLQGTSEHYDKEMDATLAVDNL